MQPISLSVSQARLLRIRAQRLIEPESGLPELFRDVFAFQAQDLPAAVLSIRARARGLNAGQVEGALRTPRAFTWTWSLRGTLHLLAAEDARWLVPFLGPQFTAGDRRRMGDLGWDEERAEEALRLVAGALARQGELTRAEITGLLAAHGFPHEGQAPIHLIARAAWHGILCPVPGPPKASLYRPFADWAGSPQPLPREEALQRLALRYLQAYAPASVNDLATWSGLRVSDARLAWQMLEDQLAPVTIEGKGAGLLNAQRPWLEEPPPPAPVVRLLPRFDTYLLGYASRELCLAPAQFSAIQNGGIISATLLVDGRVLGTWKTARRKNALDVAVTPFAPLPGDLIPLIEDEVAGIGRFLGLESRLVLG